MSADLTTLMTAAVSFVIFILIHFISFRFVGEGGVLKWTMRIFFLVSLVPVGLFIREGRDIILSRVSMDDVGYLLVAWAVYGLLSFLYILCVFGPYESSIRLRLIREIYRYHPAGISLEHLYKNYNSKIILKRRIARLLHARSIVLNDEKYRIAQKPSFFLLAEVLAGMIERCIKKS